MSGRNRPNKVRKMAKEDEGAKGEDDGASLANGGDTPKTMEEQIAEMYKNIAEMTPKMTSLYSTVLDSPDCLVTRLDNIHKDLYEPQGSIATKIRVLEERQGNTFSTAETLHTKVLGEGALLAKYTQLSKLFYHKEKGLEACYNKLTHDKMGLDALLAEIETLKVDVVLLRSDTDSEERVPSTPRALQEVREASIPDSVRKQIEMLEVQVSRLADVLTQHEGRMQGMDSCILHNTAKGMMMEYSMTGIRYHKDEDPKLAVASFLKRVLDIKVDPKEVLKARRVHPKNPFKRKINGKLVTLPPLMDVRVSPSLQSSIETHRKNLDGKKDKKYGWFYKIKRHLPDAYIAANKRWEPFLDQF